MKSSFVASFLAFSIILTPLSAVASSSDASATGDNRYFVASTKSFWKASFNARHSFEDGFTADLSPLQLRVAKFAGLKPVAVKKLTILPNSNDSSETSAVRKPVVKVRPTPSAQIPWGVKMLYQDTTPVMTASVSIAVLDSGVTKDHPDLKRRIKDCRDFTQAKSPMVEGSCDDKNGHGTHVAGIIAADGGEDGKGIFGVAPHASLMTYKVCGANGSCWSDDIAVAIRAAADNGANIINMSLGSDSVSSLIADAVAYAASKEVLIVAAAGNDGPYTGSIDWPGALVDVVAVGALGADQKIADWSSRGINTTTESYSVQEGDVELAAPGVNIESTFNDGGYAVLSGTSMASPHVAGLAALLWQSSDTHPAGATRSELHRLAHDVDEFGDDDASGWGLPTF